MEMKMTVVRRKVNRKKSEDNSNLPVEAYCRKCMKILPSENFYKATDVFLDQNQLMSVCKNCISDIYVKVFQNEHTIERSVLRLCRMLNIAYNENAISAAKVHLNTKNKLPDDPSAFGVYKGKLMATQKTEVGKRDLTEQFTFVEPSSRREISDPLDDEQDETKNLKKFWGENIGDFNDYAFLEERLSVWRKSYACQNASEEFYLKEICHKELELQRSRIDGTKSVDSILKSMNDLLKNAALTPAQATAASGSKAADTIGMILKRIETTTPAEYYKDKELFKDFDNLGTYISNYIKRPVLNFLTGNKNFELIGDDGDGFSLEDDKDTDEDNINESDIK
jgi:hypothetical protein